MDFSKGSDIQNFYANTTIFVTGATGFIGKLVLEKLLRVCDVKKIYILMREKRGKSIASRFEEIFKSSAFGPLKDQKPTCFDKVVAIIGDCSLPKLGLSPKDQDIIKNEVNIIIHPAASLHFDEPLKTAANINVRAVRDLLHIATEMKQLKSFVHISTAYSNCMREDVDEVFYKPHMTCDQLLAITESMDEKIILHLTKFILDAWPNSYSFTKALAENAIETYGQHIPIGVIRPSIVVSASSEPVPGYIDNWYGLTYFLLGSAIGLVRVICTDESKLLDIIPVDFVVNTIIASAVAIHNKFMAEKETGAAKSSRNIPIYNCVSSTQNPITIGKSIFLGNKYGRAMPNSYFVWHSFCVVTRSPIIFNITTALLHKLPAYVTDFVVSCTGGKPTLVIKQEVVDTFLKKIIYFITRGSKYGTSNTKTLWKDLSIKDKHLFNFDVAAIDWDQFFPIYVEGMRTHLLKQDASVAGKAKL